LRASIETVGGKVVLTVHYNSATCDWNEAIATGLASYGLKEGKVKVIAVPLPANAQEGLFER
jgi:hypothetical protein